MALRNFWANVKVDGRKTEYGGGPKSKNGGLEVHVYQREDGEKKTAVYISCREHDGQLITTVEVGGEVVGKFITER